MEHSYEIKFKIIKQVLEEGAKIKDLAQEYAITEKRITAWVYAEKRRLRL